MLAEFQVTHEVVSQWKTEYISNKLTNTSIWTFTYHLHNLMKAPYYTTKTRNELDKNMRSGTAEMPIVKFRHLMRTYHFVARHRRGEGGTPLGDRVPCLCVRRLPNVGVVRPP